MTKEKNPCEVCLNKKYCQLPCYFIEKVLPDEKITTRIFKGSLTTGRYMHALAHLKQIQARYEKRGQDLNYEHAPLKVRAIGAMQAFGMKQTDISKALRITDRQIRRIIADFLKSGQN